MLVTCCCLACEFYDEHELSLLNVNIPVFTFYSVCSALLLYVIKKLNVKQLLDPVSYLILTRLLQRIHVRYMPSVLTPKRWHKPQKSEKFHHNRTATKHIVNQLLQLEKLGMIIWLS
jgi:hypothetical protein